MEITLKPDESSSQQLPILTRDKPRATRARAPRAKTGCLTCKYTNKLRVKIGTGFATRHVKCDEGKPQCSNCIRAGRICGGYEVKPRKNARVLKFVAEPTLNIFTLDRPPPILVQPQPSIELAGGEKDRMYFDDWLRLARVSASGSNASAKLWQASLPQLSSQVRSLRHAAMSIGAMNRAIATAPWILTSKGRRRRDPLQVEAYHDAVGHYCRALRMLGGADAAKVSMQETLLLSLLFLLFEVMRGNLKIALDHLGHGFAIFRQLKDRKNRAGLLGDLAPDPPQLLAEVIDMYVPLGVQAQGLLNGRVGGDNDANKPGGGGGGGSSTLYIRGHAMETLTTEFGSGMASVIPLGPMPLVFGSVSEAAEHWKAIQKSVSEQGPKLMAAIKESKFTELVESGDARLIMEQLEQNPELQMFAQQTAVKLRAWNGAFHPLYHRLTRDRSVDREVYLRAVHLRVDYLGQRIFSCFPQHGQQAVMASLTPFCREINKLCEIILRERRNEGGGGLGAAGASRFIVHMGIAWNLGFVAVNCRDLAVRADALRILQTYPFHDGLWDSNVFAAIALRNRRLERDNAVEGTPDEQWARLNRRLLIFEASGTRIVIQSLKKEGAEWVLIEETADIDTTDPAWAYNVEWKPRPVSDNSIYTKWM